MRHDVMLGAATALCLGLPDPAAAALPARELDKRSRRPVIVLSEARNCTARIPWLVRII